MLPPGEDMGIATDDEDYDIDQNFSMEQGFNNFLVVMGLPIAPENRVEKLKEILKSLYFDRYAKLAEGM